MLTCSQEVEQKIREEELAETGGIGETDLLPDKEAIALFESLAGPDGDPGEDDQILDDLDEEEEDEDDDLPEDMGNDDIDDLADLDCL